MNAIGAIFRKELRRVLFDKKMLLGLFVLPLVLMGLIFGVMLLLVTNMQNDIRTHVSDVVLVNAPEDFSKMLAKEKKESGCKAGEEAQLDHYKEQLKSGELDLLVVFPEGFSKQVSSYRTGDAVPQVKTYYNPSEDYSGAAKESFDAYLEEYRNTLLKKRIGSLSDVQVFTVNEKTKDSVVQDEDKAGGKMLGSLIPYMICMLLFAGVMNLGTDAFAGEKERGTLATMLVTPVKRSHIIYGKLLALMVLSALSALDYGIVMLCSFPAFALFLSASGMSFSLSFFQGAALLLLIVTLVFLYVAIIGVCAVFAKNMKEASTYLMPAYMLVIVMGMMTMFVTKETSTTSYLIPLYGSSMALRNVLTQQISAGQVFLTAGVNLVSGFILCAIMTKGFLNERVTLSA